LFPAAAAVVAQKQLEDDAGQILKSRFFSEFIPKKDSVSQGKILERRVCSDFIPQKKKKGLWLGRDSQKSAIHIW